MLRAPCALECGSLLPLFPLGGTSLLALPQSLYRELFSQPASKLAGRQSGSKLPHSKARRFNNIVTRKASAKLLNSLPGSGPV